MKTRHAIIAAALRGQTRSIFRGRSNNRAGFGSRTPIDLVDGHEPPRLEGAPHLKTTFRNGPRFTRTLYTPSTLRAVVGRGWLAQAEAMQ